jgi:peptidoglycan hydrolase-like protein with peptidoglycan-binding domain
MVTGIIMGFYGILPSSKGDTDLPVMGLPGDRSEEIAAIQGRLLSYGYDVGEINGILDLSTSEAIRRFQEDHGLDVSGSANAETLYRLGLPIALDELCVYEERRFLASALDAVCADATYLTKVALAGLIFKRQAEIGFPDELTAVVFGEPQFRETLLYDFGSEPSAASWQAVRDAANGMSPCPDALYFYRKGHDDAFLARLKIVFKNGIYYFAAPPAVSGGDRRIT